MSNDDDEIKKEPESSTGHIGDAAQVKHEDEDDDDMYPDDLPEDPSFVKKETPEPEADMDWELKARKAEKLEELCNKKDRVGLAGLALTKYGLISDDIRKRAC